MTPLMDIWSTVIQMVEGSSWSKKQTEVQFTQKKNVNHLHGDKYSP